MNKAPTLNEVLQSEGLSTRPATAAGKKEILNSDGQVVFTGEAYQVWEWLKEWR